MTASPPGGRFTAVLLAVLTLTLPLTGLHSAADAAPDAPPERWVVGFHELPADARAGGSYHGHAVVRVDERLAFLVVETRDAAGLAARARGDARVAYAERDGVAVAAFTPNDPHYANQYGPRRIDAPDAWAVTLGSTTVRVCVGDTGVRYTHEDLTGARWAGGYDFVNGDPDPWDDEGHGTFVSAIAVASTNNGVGMAGVAQATFTHVKVMNDQGRGSYSDIASGIRWCADDGAHVISLSLGGSTGSSTLLNAVNYAWNAGSLLVAASGNGYCSDCVEYPAAYANVVAVGCTTSSNASCDFTSRGPEMELVAPGHSILSASHTSDSAYRYASGTSASTPFVAGAAALVKATRPNATNGDLRHLLNLHAYDLGADGRDVTFGHGLVKPRPAMDHVNVAPVVTSVTCSPEPGRDGEEASCTFTVTDDSVSVFLEVDWGDGATERFPASGFAEPGTFTRPHTWHSGGSFTVSATATDTEPLTGNATSVAHDVEWNAAPVVGDGSCDPTPVIEKHDVRCTFPVTDDFAEVALTIDWGDGSTTRVPASGFTAPGDLSATHAYQSEGTHAMRATAVDNDHDAPLTSAPSLLDVAVDPNPAPVVTAGSCTPDPVAKRMPTTCAFNVTDDRSEVALTIDWGDGSTTRHPATGFVAPGPVEASHSYAAAGAFTVTATAVDNDEHEPLTSDPEVTTVTVDPNEAPVLESLECPEYAWIEDHVRCTFRGTDDGPGVHYVVDWGDGQSSRVPSSGTTAPGETMAASHRYAEQGYYNVTTRVVDDDPDESLADEVNRTLVVDANAAPEVSASCATGYTEGGDPVTCTFHVADDSAGVHLLVRWGDGATTRVPEEGLAAPGFTVHLTHRYSALRHTHFRVNATVSDDDELVPKDASAETSKSVWGNSPPDLDAFQDCRFEVAEPWVESTCTFRSRDRHDVYFELDWGDGSPVERYPAKGVMEPGVEVVARHVWNRTGDFTVTLRVTDTGLPAQSAEWSGVAAVRGCDFEQRGYVAVPAPIGPSVDGARVQVPPVCHGKTFRLSTLTQGDDFNLCWYDERGRDLGCHRRYGTDSGVVPDGAHEAFVYLRTGDRGWFVLHAPDRGPVEPEDGPFPFEYLRDDGSREAAAVLDDREDWAVQRHSVGLFTWQEAVGARVLVYARAVGCTGEPGHMRLYSNDVHASAEFDPCAVWPTDGWAWRAIEVPLTHLIVGENRFDLYKPRLGGPGGLDLGVDTSTGTDHSRIEEDGVDVPGELMLRLQLDRRAS